MTDIRSYVIAGLRGDGYSGLCSEECGCELDDLMPCEEPRFDCSPGYKHDCAECPRAAEDNCPVEDGGTGICVGSTKDWPEAHDD